MTTIVQENYTNNLFLLLKEAFEGPPPDTWSAFLDKGTGLFQTLEQVSAEAASTPPRTGASTIAAHCDHLRFYVVVLEGFMRGVREPIDWKQSWVKQTVTPSEWDELKAEVRRVYEHISEQFRSVEKWGDEEVGSGMAIIAHTAYHLGAIRQLVLAVAQPSKAGDEG